MSRVGTLHYRILCEGDSEYNYFYKMKQEQHYSFKINPVNMRGGGYANFLNCLRSDPDTNCLAKFIVVDGDRAINDSREMDGLKKLVDYCRNKNKRKDSTPYILIITYENFEYLACLHSPEYNGTADTENFILRNFKYKTIDSFKKDANVYEFLNKENRSFSVMLEQAKKRSKIIENQIVVKQKTYSIAVKQMVFVPEKLGIKSTNIEDLFDTLEKMKVR